MNPSMIDRTVPPIWHKSHRSRLGDATEMTFLDEFVVVGGQFDAISGVAGYDVDPRPMKGIEWCRFDEMFCPTAGTDEWNRRVSTRKVKK